jgi:hypothetical protein
VSGLVEELVALALGSDEKIVHLVRKAQVAAARLDVAELRAWTEAELNGYGGAKWRDVPAYREVYGELRGWNEILGDWIPVFDEHDKTRSAFPLRLVHSIGYIESIATAGASVMTFEGDHKVQMMKALSGALPTRIGIVVDGSKLQSVVDVVRNLVLKWALDLENAGVRGEGLSFTPGEKTLAAGATPQITNEIYNTFENIGTLVVQQGTVGSSQSVTVTGLKDLRALVEGLERAREGAALGEEQRRVLDTSIVTLKAQIDSPQPSTSVMRESLHTLRNLGEGLLASYLAAKFGIHIDHVLLGLGGFLK